MHIIRVCPAYYPHFYLGGSVVADYEIDKALIAEGHSVTVLTCKDNQADLPTELLSMNHKVVRCRSIGKSQYGISLGPIIEIVKEYFKKTDDQKIVWFGGVWNLLAILGPLICRFLSQKYVITPHGMLIPNLIDMKSAPIKKLCIKLFLKSHLTKAHKVHFTVNDELEDTILATRAKMKSVVFPLCFDLSRFERPAIHYDARLTDKITVSFIGRITPKKRIDLVIRALEMLPLDVKSKVRFNVVGPDKECLWDYEHYTKNRVGVEINYNGPLYGDDLIDAYHDTDVFILCSESENFAISVVEAAFCYCVPLITKSVGVGEYFSNTSAVFSELDALDISKNIETLVRDTKMLEEFGVRARLVSEQFSSSYLGSTHFAKLIG
jgi:glycosyltransferase involved in cell wall biosynthesis